MAASEFDPAERLNDPHARQRRRAARQLRADPDPETGERLLAALRKEVESNPPGWETQYHMCLALLAVRHQAALPFLETLLDTRLRLEPMARVAAAEAVVGLDEDQTARFLTLVRTGDAAVRTGALRAAVRGRLILDDNQAQAVVDLVPCSEETVDDDACLCLVVASAGWSPAVRADLLERAGRSPWPKLREAAAMAGWNEYDEVLIL